MAKKVTARLKDADKLKFSKVIIPVKSKKTGAYAFREKIVVSDEVQKVIKEY